MSTTNTTNAQMSDKEFDKLLDLLKNGISPGAIDFFVERVLVHPLSLGKTPSSEKQLERLEQAIRDKTGRRLFHRESDSYQLNEQDSVRSESDSIIETLANHLGKGNPF